jgi:hypothetical protein
MNSNLSPGTAERRQALMDELLRGGIPEIKLALGEVIDRENARPLPPRYARLLPYTVLRVTLREDAADALRPIAADLERELTDSCNRHGSLYDRIYRVELQRTEDRNAPRYSGAAHAGRDAADGVAEAAGPPDLSATPAPAPATSSGTDQGPPSARSPLQSPKSSPDPLPIADPDATSLGGGPPASWEDGRWVLIVEGDDGEEREVFRIPEPVVTVGRSAEDPGLRPAIAISDAPHVSRRQLALAWDERDGAPGFKVYNLGLNVIHLPGQEITGAKAGKGNVDLAALPAAHVGWLPPGVPLRIGEHGPTLRIEEVPPGPDDVWIDPDATVFD